MNSKEKIKNILDWTEGWKDVSWGYIACLELELKELVEITKMEQVEEDSHMCDGCRFRL